MERKIQLYQKWREGGGSKTKKTSTLTWRERERERERERVTENAIFTCSSLVVVFLLKASPGIGP